MGRLFVRPFGVLFLMVSLLAASYVSFVPVYVSFFYLTLGVLATGTALTFLWTIYFRGKAASRVARHLALVVGRIVVYGSYAFGVLRKSATREEAVANVVAFMVLYFIFRFVELFFSSLACFRRSV